MIPLLLVISIYGLTGESVRVNLTVPKFVLDGTSPTLKCQYDLEGEPLYAVKWYRGRHEFFRFVPRAVPQVAAFPYAGIIVDIMSSDSDQVRLLNVPKEISGNVSCEVSVDNTFKTAIDSQYLNITDFRVRKPYLNVSSNYFNPKSNICIICIAQETNPPAAINFYVDYIKIKRSYVTQLGNGLASLNKKALLHFLNLTSGEYVSPLWVSCEASHMGFDPLSSASVPIIPQFPVSGGDSSRPLFLQYLLSFFISFITQRPYYQYFMDSYYL